MSAKKEPVRSGGEKKLGREVAQTPVEEVVKSPEELGEIYDKKELTPANEVTSQKELREQIEGMDLDDNLKIQAQSHAQQIKSLEEEEKLKHLLEIARSKGVIYAVNVAKKMDDPYVLDKFHDMLTEKGMYKKFMK